MLLSGVFAHVCKPCCYCTDTEKLCLDRLGCSKDLCIDSVFLVVSRLSLRLLYYESKRKAAAHPLPVDIS